MRIRRLSPYKFFQLFFYIVLLILLIFIYLWSISPILFIWVLCTIIIIISALIIIKLDKKTKNTESDQKTEEYLYTFSGKTVQNLLTNNEMYFFNKLKEITDKYNLYIFPKVRLADIIKPIGYDNINKVLTRHVDFVVVDNKTHPLLFIELDDSSHYTHKAQINDEKKNIIFDSVNRKILRIRTNDINNKLLLIDNYLYNKVKE